MQIPALLTGLFLVTGTALGQDPLDFSLDPSASWTWSGVTSIGPLVPNPSNQFALTGNLLAELTRGTQPISVGEFVSGGSALVVPNLSAQVPNPLPGFPPLALIDIDNLSLEFRSTPFSVAASGGFTALTEIEALSGTVTVTPLIGNQTVTDLTGNTSLPQAITGTLTQNGLLLEILAASQGSFVFVDPSSGLSAQIDLVGSIDADHTCPPASTYCPGALNSGGVSASISMTGSRQIQNQSFGLLTSNLPSGQFAYYLTSRTQGLVSGPGGSQGNLCLGGSIGRFNAQVGMTQNGSFAIQVDLDNLPTSPSSSVQPGESWNFQLWYRDVNPTATSNFSNGLTVSFCP